MSITLRRGDRLLLLWGGVLFTLLLAVTVAFARGPAYADENPSSHATGSSGAKAAYLLVRALGYDVARWEQPPEKLTAPGTTTLILAEPSDLPGDAHRRAIQSFIERGGRVIATGPTGAWFLPGRPVPDSLAGLTWTRARAATPSSHARAAPEITIAPRASWRSDTFSVTLYGDDDAPLVVWMPIGDGEAYWWSAATPLTNAGLREPGNVEFFLSCLGDPAGRRVLFDEYFHGARQSLAATVLQSPIKWLGLQLGLLALAILWTYARRSGPILAPAPEWRLSPLEFVRTLGSLYQRAGAASVAVGIAHRRFRFWLARRLRIAPNTSMATLEIALRARWPSDASAVLATLSAAETAGADTRLRARDGLSLVRSLGDHAVALRLFPLSAKELRR